MKFLKCGFWKILIIKYKPPYVKNYLIVLEYLINVSVIGTNVISEIINDILNKVFVVAPATFYSIAVVTYGLVLVDYQGRFVKRFLCSSTRPY